MSDNQPTDLPVKVTLSELLNASEGVSEALAEGAGGAEGGMSPERLEQLRRSVDLKVDAEGRWWHEGEPFTHPRLISYFNRQLGWRGGEATLNIGGRWCYVACDVTPFLILKLELDEDLGLFACLNTEERLPLKGLELQGEVLFAQLKEDRLARLSRHAQAQCATWLREATLTEPEASSGFALERAGRVWPIRQGSEPSRSATS